MADSTPKSLSTDPTLYLYTSLSSGSSHVVTATARLETILRSHQIPFQAIDVATDEQARRLWGRRAKGRKLPGLVRSGSVVGVSLHGLGCDRSTNDRDELDSGSRPLRVYTHASRISNRLKNGTSTVPSGTRWATTRTEAHRFLRPCQRRRRRRRRRSPHR